MNVKENYSLRQTASPVDKVLSNEDLLSEILLRLPAKLLVKFKCVSKHWLSLISNKSFCYNHSARTPNVASAIYYYSDLSCSRLKSLSLKSHQNLLTLPLFDGTQEGDTISVTHACNGLILCARKFWQDEYICIYNLTTNKHTVLLEGPPASNDMLLACISYDPAKSPYYKVVLTRNPNLIDIYFSENSSWKSIQVTRNLYTPDHKAYWDGSIHWIHYPNTHLKFDVDKETLTVLSLPPEPRVRTYEMIHYFEKCGESLILIQPSAPQRVEFNIFMMEKGATDWTVKQKVNLLPIVQTYPQNDTFYVLSVLKGPLEGDVALILAAKQNIFKYNLRCETLDVICDFKPLDFMGLKYHQLDNPNRSFSTRPFHFIESLAPV